MAGSYLEGQGKTLSGVYSLIQALISSVTGGQRGIVAVPFTANWGPVGTLELIGRATEFDTKYNTEEGATGIGDAVTAQRVRTLAYKAKPYQVLAYRMASAAAARGTVALGGGWVLETAYPSDRAFTIIVKPGLAAGATAVQIVEDGVMLLSVEDSTVEGLRDKLNASGIVNVQTEGAELPTATAGQAFAGGNNGDVATATEYGNFLAEVEADHTANAVAFDGVTDPALLTTLDAWVRRVRDEGLYITVVRGGAAGWDSDLGLANAQSRTLNYRGVINVGNGVDGYTSAEMAVYIAAYAAAIPLNQGMTDQPVPFEKVNVKTPLTVGGRIGAKNAGTLVFVMEGGQVLIDEDVNTLTTASGLETAEMGSIRINNTLDYVIGSLESFGNEYKKTRSNTQPARQAYASMVEDTFFKPLVRQEVIQPGYSYKEDPDYHGKDPVAVPKLNQAFFASGFTPVDSMEQIYQKFGVQF